MRIVHLEGTLDAWTFRRFARDCADLGVKPVHVLHVGGHLGQEIEHYRAAGAERITYMEPTPELAMRLRELGDDVTVYQAAAGDPREDGATVPLFLCGGDGAWNTLRRDIGSGAGVHRATGWIDVDVLPIRAVQGDANVLVVDTQGTEIEALRTAQLTGLDLVIVETQASGHPEAAHVRDVDEHMRARGWAPVLAWNHERPGRPHHTFADVFYVPAATLG